MRSGRISVLIVDDHPVTRAGLRRILEETPEMEVVAEASNGAEAMESLRRAPADVVLLDIALRDMSGIEVLNAIKNLNPDVKVLMVSMYPEDQYALRSLKAGASGYLNKESAPSELMAAIRKVAQGGKSVSPAVAERLAWDVDRTRAQAGHEALSNREFEILRMIAAGQSISQIAKDLHLSVKTVSTYRRRLLDKMDLKNNAELVQYAIKAGLVV